jgi:predicted DNA-binding transcriptional regulator YafY
MLLAVKCGIFPTKERISMSYKFDSLITILKKLDQRETVTVHSLMNDLEISERTAYRYILTLQTAGFPITFDRKKESYIFSEKYSLGKPNLTVEETLALSLSKNFLKSFGETMEKSIETIEKKLSLKKTSVPKHIIVGLEGIPPSVGAHLEAIHRAISSYKRIEIQYKTLYSEEETTRRIDPYFLFYVEGLWHLRGYCHLREELRTFALDRIVSLKTLSEYFLPQNVSSEVELSGSFGSVIDGDPVEVILRFSHEIKPYILRRQWHQSQKTRELKNGQLEVTFHVNGIEGIKSWIYRWIPYVQIIAPKALRELAKAEIQKAAKNIS